MHELFDLIPKEEIDRIFAYECNELDEEFLGFTEFYKALSTIIPKHFVVIDFGCYAALQGYYFKDHKAYIGVDISDVPKLSIQNAIYYKTTIQNFIANHEGGFDLGTTFAICNYVPDDEAEELVRKTYKNVFVFYPDGLNVILKWRAA